MTKQIRTTCALFTGALLMSAALPDTAFAVDGQIAITQARAMAGGVTPGDAPGFPVTITQPGSYVLSSNLTVPDIDTTGILIAASHVTLDLNGFAILGPADCSGGFLQCSGGTGDGVGTQNVQFNVTVRNGTVQGMGRVGIQLRGDSHLVEYIHARSNGGGGISVGTSADNGLSIVQHSTAQRNSGDGIFVDMGLVRDNVADVNRSRGIAISSGGSAIDNVATRNGIGLAVFGSYRGNTMFQNALTDNLSGGVNLGQNLCGNAPCPGAQF